MSSRPPSSPPTPKRPRYASEDPLSGQSGMAKKFVRHIGTTFDKNGKFKMGQMKSRFLIEDVPPNPEELLLKLFEHCIYTAMKESREKGAKPDHLGVIISSQLLNPDIWIPLRPINENSAEAILNRFLLVAQSKTKEGAGSLWGEPFSVSVITLDKASLPKKQQIRGRGGGRQRKLNPIRHRINQKAMIRVNNDGANNYCLFYALELTRIHNTKQMDGRKFYKYSKNLKHQTNDVYRLLNAAKIPKGLSSYDAVQYVPKVVDYWNSSNNNKFKFKVFIFDSIGHYKAVFSYGAEDFNQPIAIYHDGKDHFHGIRHNAGRSIFGRRSYCYSCECPYTDVTTHKRSCKALCQNCSRIRNGPCTPSDGDKLQLYKNYCTGCKKTFVSKDCYLHHLSSNFCAKSKKCKECGIIYSVRDNYRNGRGGHVCDERYCNTCGQYHNSERGCFIAPIDAAKNHNHRPYRVVFFDFESYQHQEEQGSGFDEKPKRAHEVNFIAAKVTCSMCLKKKKSHPPANDQEDGGGGHSCWICGANRTITFSHQPFNRTAVDEQRQSDFPLSDFVNWLLYEMDKRYTTYAFSHFGGRYDMVLTFREIFLAGFIPFMIRQGNKMYEMNVPKSEYNGEVVFRDSYNLMPVPLADTIAAFGLQGVRDKPFFPYLANHPQNLGKTLTKLPPKSDYFAGGMKQEKRKNFDEWYAAHEHEPFCLDEKLAEYCVNDVEILAAAMLAFRKEFKRTSNRNGNGGIDILCDSMTIAAACMKHFRLNHLKEEHIGIVPERGYDSADNQSTIALKYLQWYEEEHGVKLQTANSPGGEFRVGNYQLDAYDSINRLGIEVNGCCWHACSKCYPDPHFILPNNRTVEKQRELEETRMEFIKKRIPNIKIIWTCEIREMLAKSERMKSAFANYKDTGPIRPRDAFYGGRTGPFRLHYEAPAGYKISYLDFTSLYPYTTTATSYPIGHPKVHVISGDKQSVDWRHSEQIPIKGMLKVFVVPPDRIDVPVLPAKFDEERLLFPLCRACSLKYPQGGFKPNYRCNHTDDERGWVSTCTSIELTVALDEGYRVTRYYRALEYTDWDDQLFKGYVSEFMAMKIHASGFPKKINTRKKEKKFIRQCKRRFGIRLRQRKMRPNKAKRTIAKLANNNLWGRFGLRNMLSKTEITDCPAKLREFLDNKKIEINSLEMLTDECLMITYTPNIEFVEENQCSNVVVSLWTTSAARLILLKALQKIARAPGCTLLYCDTDSIMFAHPDHLPPPLEAGPHLGDLSVEYPEYDIREFVCGGCKNYALRMTHKKSGEEKTTLKVRGITLTTDVCKTLHFESLKQSVLSFASSENSNSSNEKELDENMIFVDLPQIRPSIVKGAVYSVPLCKCYRPIVPKAIVVNDFVLRDFGTK